MTSQEAVKQLHTELKAQLTRLKKQQKIISAYEKKPHDFHAMENLIHMLRIACQNDEINSHYESLIDQLQQELNARRASARTELLTALNQKLDGQVSVLSDNPLELNISPLTLCVDTTRGTASLCYAREIIKSTSLDVNAILAERTQIAEFIKKTRLPSPLFFTTLLKAYRMTLIMQEKQSEERLDIVELLPALTLLIPQPKNTPYPKYLLAYQLQRLRRDKCLSLNNQRVLLGTATGGSARQKKNVLFIPHGSQEGQYYLSICFRAD